ncbi:hypothetical protein COL154_004360 [Colletotrichum chrysophilum]|nr:hypothetical protein KNSL1_012088 [Colletotrichum chrysophilum]KAJ0365505.1 hypothetical protein COL154_004360 [Colletotrichum chrysophilum]
MRADIFTLAVLASTAIAQDALTCRVIDPIESRTNWFTVESGNCCNLAGALRIKNHASVNAITQLKGIGGSWVAYSLSAGEECTTNLGLSRVASYTNFRYSRYELSSI